MLRSKNNKARSLRSIKYLSCMFVLSSVAMMVDAAPVAGQAGGRELVIANDGRTEAVVVVVPEAKLALTAPTPRQIVQRDAKNLGLVRLRGAISGPVTRVEARATLMPGATGKAAEWTKIAGSADITNGTFSSTMELTGGGWYVIEVRVVNDGKIVAEEKVEKVGVGEIFIAAGQSNAANHGGTKQSPTDDRVSAWNGQGWQLAADPQPLAEGTNGSPWPLLGDLLVEKLNVPVGIISVGEGGTAVYQWLPQYDYYQRIKNALVMLGTNGVRAVLWHQGESDAARGTSAEKYAEQLNTIIKQSRLDAGYDVPWFIASASYLKQSKEHEEAIRNGQRKVCDGRLTFQGAVTDDLRGDFRATDGHFSDKGLKEHARRWADALLAAEKDGRASDRSAIMAEYRRRLDVCASQRAKITACAEAVAQRWVASRHTLIYLAYQDNNFTDEQWARAGGLDNARGEGARIKMRSTNDVYVAGPRSWETNGVYLLKGLKQAKKNGWLTVVFGSRRGMPADLPVDFLIDNGASGGGEDEATINELVNVTHAWMWNCELTAALTRQGWRPGILKGVPLPGATANNKEYQTGEPALYPCSEAVPAGALACEYLRAIETELADLESPTIQDAIARAVHYAVAHLNAGHTVWATSFTHLLNGECARDLKSPIKTFMIADADPAGGIKKNVKPGDLLFFFGEWTVNLSETDFLAAIRGTKADYIPSFRPGTEAMEPVSGPVDYYDRRVPDALMVLEQHWPFENAAVAIPFAPGKMAPVSGVYLGLMYRMLDEAIARELAAHAPGVVGAR